MRFEDEQEQIKPSSCVLEASRKLRVWREVREKEKILTNCSSLAVSPAHISVRRPKSQNSWNRLTIVWILEAVSFASCPNMLLILKNWAVNFTALQLRVNLQISNPPNIWQIIGISIKSSTLTRANNNLKYFPTFILFHEKSRGVYAASLSK